MDFVVENQFNDIDKKKKQKTGSYMKQGTHGYNLQN